MDRWVGKIAVVTGASSGIGAQIVIDFVNAGLIVVGLARRVERVEELKSKLSVSSTGVLHAIKCDVTREEDIKQAFKWTIDNLGGVDVLVNNAGIGRNFNLIDKDNTTMVREIIDTNVMAVVLCTREAFQSMKSRNFDGHIFVINSIAGHKVPYSPFIGSANAYAPSKYAVTAMIEVFRQEFQRDGTGVKITSISPGVVKTEITAASGVDPKNVEELFKTLPYLESKDISQAVIYALSTKPHVQELKSKISTGSTGVLHAIKCDVTREEDIKQAFKWTIDNLGGVDVLVNNAGIARHFNLIDKDNTTMVKEIIDTNVMAVVLCIREAFQSMKSRNFDGHIIVINSKAGHKVPYSPIIGSYNAYARSKYAVTAMVEVFRQEFQRDGTRVKITSISPGYTKTEITAASGVDPNKVEELYKTIPFLESEDISQDVCYALSTKSHVQVHELIIKPVGEAM